MGLGPSSHPPGNDNLASPQRDRIAPKNTMDERISRMRLWGISQRVMPSAQTVKVSPVWVQRHPSRRKMVTAVCTSDSAGQLCSTVSPSQRSAAASSGSVLFFAPCTVSSPQRRLPPRTKTASCRAQPYVPVHILPYTHPVFCKAARKRALDTVHSMQRKNFGVCPPEMRFTVYFFAFSQMML